MIKVTQHNKWVILGERKRHPGQFRNCQCLVPRCERKQGDIPGLLNRARKATLMGCAYTRQTTRYNLAALGHKPLQQTDIAVRNSVNLLRTELADLLAAEEFSATAGATGGPTARTTGRATARARA